MQKSDLYKNLPETPGVYIMKNATGGILYVGKAANLRRRVSSYFLRPQNARIEALVSEIATISHEDTDTSLEALILESRFIKRHLPPYNIREKDDKSFLYVLFTKDAFSRVLLVRGKDMTGGRKNAYGPFVSASSARAALRILRKIFPWSDHLHPTPSSGFSHFSATLRIRGTKRGVGLAKYKPCFNYQIGLCAGTCVNAITRADYAKNIKNLKLFFKGEKKKIIRALEMDMQKYAKTLQFEKAGAVQRKLFALRHIQDTALINKDEKDESVLITAIAVISTNANSANRVKKSRIEGYDISNISGTNAVGAMVVFTNGVSDKSEYRIFNIRTIQGPDDIAMMREVLMRRFENSPPHLNNCAVGGKNGDGVVRCGGKQWPLPDAILVDGGLGQVHIARTVLKDCNLTIPVVGIAKGVDRKNNRFIGRVPPCATGEILIQIRDEAHRFSHTRHIRRRAKNFLP